jgi:hypothetical protein
MLRNLTLIGLPVCVLGLSLYLISQDQEHAPVEIAVLNEKNWDRLVPRGKEVDAIYGDIVLRNKYVTAVIAEPLGTRNANMTVRDVGGCLIDFTERQQQSDQLSCFYPGQRAFPYRQWSVSTREERGVMVTPTLERKSGVGIVTVRSEGTESRPTVEVEYRLGVESRVLTIVTRYINTAGTPLTVSLTDDLRADGGKEEMTKTPNGSGPEFWFEDHFWRQAYGFRAPQYTLQCNSDARRTAINYLNSSQQDVVTLPAGESFELVRELACGADRLAVAAAFAHEDGLQIVPVTLSVWDAARRPIPEASLEVRQGDTLLGRPRANEQGDARLLLPPGTYQVNASANGQVIQSNYELRVADALEQRETLIAGAYHPGKLRLQVREGRQGIPAKVEILGQQGTPTPNFGPETAEFGVKNLRYTPDGRVEQDLLPGSYRLIVSRGPEYSAFFTEFTILAGQTTDLNAALIREVETTGWISSDFHSHASPSGDNTSSQLGRVLNLVCEHLEFAPCTEHNRISTYEPHIDALRIRPFFSSTTGMELTGSPLPLNHQNVFPLKHHPHRQDGGGPVTDVDIEVQMQRVAAWDDGSEKLIQQNHPDVGWLFYDRDGDGKPDGGYARSVELIDVMEIHPITLILKTAKLSDPSPEDAKANQMFKWLQLLNQGYRIPGVVNTDAHYNFHGSGWLRNWIQCATDDPAKIDPMEIVRASEEGRLIMSNAPFLRATVSAGGQTIVCGQDLPAPGGKVTVQFDVQCPNWCDIDTAMILVNGRAREDLIFTRSSHPQLFRSEGAVRFAHTAELTLTGDAHLVLVGAGQNSTLGPVMGPDAGKQPPVVVTNPFFIDVDGNGFQPNRDTLGLPLPVKGD